MAKNPYRSWHGKPVVVKFTENGGDHEFMAKGKLSCKGYEAMVEVGGWVIGIANIKSIEPTGP